MSVSTGFKEITKTEAARTSHAFAWQDPSIPLQQYDIVREELRLWKSGQPFQLYDVVRAATSHFPVNYRVLDVGCGVGHYADVLKHVGNMGQYVGVDYSQSFIDVAWHWHQDFGGFYVSNALALMNFKNQSFDVVLHSGCIMHLYDWQAALIEAMRVTKQYLLLHRTPISTNGQPRYFHKKAYGVDCLEIWFNEADLFDVLHDQFDLKRVWHLSTAPDCTYMTYLLERR